MPGGAAVTGRVVRLLAVAAASASLVVAVPSAASAKQDGFADVPGGVHKPAIDVLAAEGVFEGTLCGDGMFCPDEPVTRATVAVWLVRALGDSAPAVRASRFADVDAADPWARFVERLAEREIAIACRTDPLRYCPDEAPSRAQTATMLVRAFDLEAAPPAGFLDTGGHAHEADIDAVAGARIAVDCERDPLRFCPDEAVTRAELAVFLARALGLVPLPAEFAWSLPSHCPKDPPTDPHAAPEAGCPAWWGHLMDLEPSAEGISIAEMEARLATVLPFYTTKFGDGLGLLSGPSRQVITATLERLAAEDPETAEMMHTISAQPNRCGEGAAACAPVGGINFVSLITERWWLTTVDTVVHEWVHNREFGSAPGGVYSTAWCNRMAESVSVAESTGRLVTHQGLLESAGPAHEAPLVTGEGCSAALIARFEPEIRSHDRPAYIAELSANAQTQAWMRRGYASAEARWWAAEAAAGYPGEGQPLAEPLMTGPLPEPPAEPEEPGDCNDGMHDHPYRADTRHYHSDGLEPHEHDRRYVLVDGVAVPGDSAEPAGTSCEYPGARRVVSSFSYTPNTRLGDPVSVSYRSFSPDERWYSLDLRRCVDITTPGHPRHDPAVASGTSSALQRVCDRGSEPVWVQCGSSGATRRCPTEEQFADGEYGGGWVVCGVDDSSGGFNEICRRTSGRPIAR